MTNSQINAALDTIDTAVADIRGNLGEQSEVIPPDAQGDAISVPAGGTIAVDLWANDAPGSAPLMAVEVLTPPTRGALIGTDQPGRWTYTAGLTAGADSAVYQDVAQDGGQSMPATLAITITELKPPSPTPTPIPTHPLLGFHIGMCRDAGVATDVIAAAQGAHKNLTPKAEFPKIVAVWFAKNDPRGSAPGWGNKADTFQRLTDQGARALVRFPPGYSTQPDIFRSIIAGENIPIWEKALRWMDMQGQHSPIICLVEPGLRGSFPWGIAHAKDQQHFDDAREAFTVFFKYIRKSLPGAHIVISHFDRPHTRDANGNDRLVHPDMYSPDPKLYDGDHIDLYDGKGKPFGPDNAEQMFTAISRTFDGREAPYGLDAWSYWAKSRKHTCAVDECGIVCPKGADPARDNAFFVRALDARAKKLGLMHQAWFRPTAIEHKLFPTCNLGTTHARDAFMELHNVA